MSTRLLGLPAPVVRDLVPAFMTDAGLYLTVFALSHVLDAAGASSGEVAAVFGVYTLAYAALAPLVGGVSDGRSRRRSLLLGGGLFLATAIGLAALIELTPGSTPEAPLGVAARLPVPGGVPAVVYTGMTLFALANALFWPALQARIGDFERDPAALGRAIRFFNIGWTAGKALGFLAAGVLFELHPPACLAAGALSATVVLAALAVAPDAPAAPDVGPPPGPAPPSATPPELKRAFLIAALVTNFGLWGTLATLKALAPKLGTALGLSELETGALLFAALAAQGVGFVALDRTERWAYRRGPLLAATPLAATGLGLLYLASGLPLALVGALLIGSAQAVSYASSVFYSLDYEAGRRGLRTGIHEAVLGAGGALPILGGWLADRTGELEAPLLFMCALGAAASVVVVALLRRADGRARLRT